MTEYKDCEIYVLLCYLTAKVCLHIVAFGLGLHRFYE